MINTLTFLLVLVLVVRFAVRDLIKFRICRKIAARSKGKSEASV